MISEHTHENSFLRFLSALFVMVGFGAASPLISRKDWLRQNLALPIFAADGASILSQLFSLRACGNAAAQLHHHLRQSTLRLLSLAQARSRWSGALDVPHDNDAFMPPVPWQREACDYLTAQNVAARVPALYAAWDRLEDQAGRLIRWSAERERERASDPWVGGYPGGGFAARLFAVAQAFVTLAPACLALAFLLAARVTGRGAAIWLRFIWPALPARASPDTS